MVAVAVHHGKATIDRFCQGVRAYRVVAVAWVNHMPAATDSETPTVHDLEVVTQDLFLYS